MSECLHTEIVIKTLYMNAKIIFTEDSFIVAFSVNLSVQLIASL